MYLVVLLLYVRGSAQLHFYLVEDRCNFSIFENPMAQVVRFWYSQIRFYPAGFCNIGLQKKTDSFFRSKSRTLKLGVGSHKNQPYFDVTMWRYRVDVVPNLLKFPVPG